MVMCFVEGVFVVFEKKLNSLVYKDDISPKKAVVAAVPRYEDENLPGNREVTGESGDD